MRKLSDSRLVSGLSASRSNSSCGLTSCFAAFTTKHSVLRFASDKLTILAILHTCWSPSACGHEWNGQQLFCTFEIHSMDSSVLSLAWPAHTPKKFLSPLSKPVAAAVELGIRMCFPKPGHKMKIRSPPIHDSPNKA